MQLINKMKKKYIFLLLVLILIGYLVKQNIDKQGKEESKEMIKIKEIIIIVQ